MRGGVGLTADPRYPLVLAQALASCAHYCILYAAVYIRRSNKSHPAMSAN
jgi:hypothetical protein